MKKSNKCPGSNKGHVFSPQKGTGWFKCDNCSTHGIMDILTREWIMKK